jgi:hypothetical protein
MDAMWAELDLGMPTINGYSGMCPPGWLPLYDSRVSREADIERLGPALFKWAWLHGLRSGEICWVGGRNEAIAASP